jgi:pimeloyl-ACP methyl ester carboxylesterase
LESYTANAVEYATISFEGSLIRTIVTKPKTTTSKKLPAVFLVPWLSCGSIEIPGDPADGFDHIIKSFANNPDVLFFRVERMGVGDSQGTPCGDLDAKTEIALYRQALESLYKKNDVDSDQVYMLGLSLGMSLAPLVAEGFPIKGFMVSGGTTKTWYEHMLEFERHRLQLSGVYPDTLNVNMKLFIPFYQKYLIDGKSPEEIIRDNPQFSSIWYDMPYHQYGRNYTYFQQVQQLNFEKAWADVQVPVFAIHGEYDWVMSLQDHQRAVDIVNSSGKKNAELVILPKSHHLLSTFNSAKEAFDDEVGIINKEAYNYFLKWLSERIK